MELGKTEVKTETRLQIIGNKCILTQINIFYTRHVGTLVNVCLKFLDITFYCSQFSFLFSGRKQHFTMLRRGMWIDGCYGQNNALNLPSL